ncbi:non-ribosomal peptide synthetase [Pseudozyma hubeiensis SY62]|uniref:Non-ribosomal peptide synthetase n=1 Tax=Pseudozyma hubeiensis (strain SY62) TaxID=1305764 RepID=R9P9T0_PSEHS|nr:non-ribosomal peptide synthetase [Pseudozyma hubeiensis SY62]GAC98007.1 non-ribosomal peptide synthetase [Pseudozyma hubeiensis SY62]
MRTSGRPYAFEYRLGGASSSKPGTGCLQSSARWTAIARCPCSSPKASVELPSCIVKNPPKHHSRRMTVFVLRHGFLLRTSTGLTAFALMHLIRSHICCTTIAVASS